MNGPKSAPDTAGMSAFTMHLPNKTDRIGQGYTVRTPTALWPLISNIGPDCPGLYGNPPPVTECSIVGREFSRSLIAGFSPTRFFTE
jgi:hypothetical protein